MSRSEGMLIHTKVPAGFLVSGTWGLRIFESFCCLVDREENKIETKYEKGRKK